MVPVQPTVRTDDSSSTGEIDPGGPATAAEPSAPVATCPFPHHLLGSAASRADGDGGSAAVCPFPLAPSGTPVHRTRADLFVRRLLRIRERPVGVTHAQAYATFRRSMTISAIRCTLTYVVFPFVMPAVGFATGVGPVVGITIGVVAITCDVYTIRRFFAVDHKWRWPVAGIALSVIGLLSVLLVQDISHLLT